MRPRLFLTADQEADLRAHLVPILGVGEALERALFNLDCACFLATDHIESAKKVEAERKVAQETRRRHAHHKTIARLAGKLRERLGIEPPEAASDDIDWATVDTLLARVAHAAATDASLTGPRRPGRTPLYWRDNLIAFAFACYPAGVALKSADSHFEQTVELLLGFLGHPDPANVHDALVDALARQPQPEWWIREIVDDAWRSGNVSVIADDHSYLDAIIGKLRQVENSGPSSKVFILAIGARRRNWRALWHFKSASAAPFTHRRRPARRRSSRPVGSSRSKPAFPSRPAAAYEFDAALPSVRNVGRSVGWTVPRCGSPAPIGPET